MATKIVYLPKPFKVRDYTKKELKHLLELSDHVLNKWLDALQPQLGEPLAGKYSVNQVLLIIEKYGVPGTVTDVDYFHKAA